LGEPWRASTNLDHFDHASFHFLPTLAGRMPQWLVNDPQRSISPNTSFTYDAAENLTNDGSHSYFYDAENRLVQIDGTAGTCSTACYTYDALGNRAEKVVGSTAIEYVYNL